MWAFLGCSEASEADGLPPIGPGVPADIFPGTATSIEFTTGSELMLFPGQAAELEVQVLPPEVHTVRFALLGQAEDAFLSPSVVDTDAEGHASASLTALVAASNFTVRAAAGRVSETLDVVTLQASVASLVVTPNYAGSRPIEDWVASVHLDTSCSALQGIPFPDGPITSRGRGIVRIDEIPAEVPLAVVVRARQYVGGCRVVTALRAQSVSDVTVDVMDRPMQVADLSFEVGFGVEPTEAPNPALDELAFRAVTPLAGGASDDLTALLDSMGALSDDPAAFAAARAAQGWRAALVTQLGTDRAGVGLRTLVQNWMRSGIELLEVPGALEGTLTSIGPGGSASLELASVVGLAPDAAGFNLENTASVVTETEDFLRLGAALELRPSAFLSAAANQAALARDPARTSAADAMATEFGCAGVASTLASLGAEPGEAFAGCDEACALELCRGAMEVLWSRVAGSELPAVPWQISGAARAQIDDAARPTQVDGNWIGTISVADFGPSPIQGPFSGEAIP